MAFEGVWHESHGDRLNPSDPTVKEREADSRLGLKKRATEKRQQKLEAEK